MCKWSTNTLEFLKTFNTLSFNSVVSIEDILSLSRPSILTNLSNKSAKSVSKSTPKLPVWIPVSTTSL